MVTETPVYETAKQNAKNLSDVSYYQFLKVKYSTQTYKCYFMKANVVNKISFFLSVCFQLHYRLDYNANVKGTNTAPAVTVDNERARLASYIQSDVR